MNDLDFVTFSRGQGEVRKVRIRIVDYTLEVHLLGDCWIRLIDRWRLGEVLIVELHFRGV